MDSNVLESHLLARRGLAERIGNLVGCLNFTEDQLRQTQKGLKDAGVAMPNFSNVGRELAKEINEEEIETEEEREYNFFCAHCQRCGLNLQVATDYFWRTKFPYLLPSALCEASWSGEHKPFSVFVYGSPNDTSSRYRPIPEVC